MLHGEAQVGRSAVSVEGEKVDAGWKGIHGEADGVGVGDGHHLQLAAAGERDGKILLTP